MSAQSWAVLPPPPDAISALPVQANYTTLLPLLHPSSPISITGSVSTQIADLLVKLALRLLSKYLAHLRFWAEVEAVLAL